ncbi:MAG: type 4a pilus biogenesis protein PilO [bacterium]|nr:type 4a pilus biogenesis protein PilO [bacterium]
MEPANKSGLVNSLSLRETYKTGSRYFKKLQETTLAKPQVRAGVEVLLSAILVSFFALFAIRPTINTIADLYSQIKVQKEIARQLDSKILALKTARQVWTQETSNLALLDQAMPVKASPIQFLQQVEGYTAKADVAIEAFTIDDIAITGEEVLKSSAIRGKVPNTNSMKLSLTVRGSYEKLLAFLKDSEGLRRVIEVDTVTIGETKESKLSGELSLTITGATSYLRKE